MPNELQVFRGKPIGSDQLTKEQRTAVGYFFARLKAADPIEYDRMMPDQKTEAILKREYAYYIASQSRESIDLGLTYWHEQRQAGNPDFRYLNIDRILGLINESGGCAAHRYFLPAPAETKEEIEARKAVGREKMQSIMGLFDE